MKINNYHRLVKNLAEYSYTITLTKYTFNGPSLYFHQKALECQQTEFLSNRHIEYVYATLVAWGMHRMGPTGTKMPNFDEFTRELRVKHNSHRKPIEVPQISLICSMLMLIPLSGDSSGISLGVRSVALLQVA